MPKESVSAAISTKSLILSLNSAKTVPWAPIHPSKMPTASPVKETSIITPKKRNVWNAIRRRENTIWVKIENHVCLVQMDSFITNSKKNVPTVLINSSILMLKKENVYRAKMESIISESQTVVKPVPQSSPMIREKRALMTCSFTIRMPKNVSNASKRAIFLISNFNCASRIKWKWRAMKNAPSIILTTTSMLTNVRNVHWINTTTEI